VTTTQLVLPGRAVLRRPATRGSARPDLRRAVAASYFGSAIEFYDYFIYGMAAALVFPAVFFPNLSPTLAAMASMGSFATAFVARPIGAAVFGHYGDRIGRKGTLTATLLLMGLATVGVGLLPGAATIGVAAPVILILLRLLQGFAAGGEWAGAALLCTENAPGHMRGRAVMFLQLGIGSGVVLANSALLLSHKVFGETSSTFLQWGWRIPFLLSAILIGVGFYVRLHLEETVEFNGSTATTRTGLPIADLVRRQTPEVLLGAGAVTGAFMLFYQGGTFMAGYAKEHLNFSGTSIFAVSALGGLCLMATVVLSGCLTDRFGARRLALVGYLVAVPWSLAMLPLMHTGDPRIFAGTMLATYTLVGLLMSPISALLPQIFPTPTRYTGAAMANNLGGIVGGGLVPVISPLLMVHGLGATSAMMAGLCMVSVISLVVLGVRRADR
jgi:MFS family permease